jgi:DNA repair protein RadC
MSSTKTTGHRSRLRSRFLENDDTAQTEESILELLLTYAIPRKDVQPLARQLLSKFGDIKSVFQAKVENLCDVEGIGKQAAVLIRVVNLITKRFLDDKIQTQTSGQVTSQLLLPFPEAFQSISKETEKTERVSEKAPELRKKDSATPLFANAVLKEAIHLLPTLPEATKTLAEARQFFRENLHYSADSTRKRNSAYLARRMFPNGEIDHALTLFAKRYANTQTLREVCFYRFIKAEPLAARILENLFVPKIGQGKLGRNEVKNYLQALFPESKSI